jgi:hypothetical protein
VSAVYTFLSWVRQGLSGAGLPPDTPSANASALPASTVVPISLKISGNEPIPKNVRIAGPGDVIGIDPKQVVRCDPPPFTRGFEPNFMAAVEFDRPDFPWMFTPASPNAESRLRPWLCLIVVKKGQGIELRNASGDQVPILAIGSAINLAEVLPDLKDSWGWAHAQVSGELNDPNSLDAIISGSPERTVSRLICPQRLAPDTSYIACVVPTFEAGRLAGLGLPLTDEAKSLNPAWRLENQQLSRGLLLPVYYSWEFTTSAPGDFQSLVEKLQPRSASGLGVRDMVVDDNVLSFEGALRGSETEFVPFDNEAAKIFGSQLRWLVNDQAVAGGERILGPPVYGGTYVNTVRIPDQNSQPVWLSEINLNPCFRSIAALGTSVIQAQQEALMASAWEQAGEVERANTIRKNAQLLRAVSGSIYQNHLLRLPESSLIQVTRPLHARVVVETNKTIERAIADSNTPVAVTTSAFRRATRPRGPILRRVLPSTARTVRPFVAQMAAGKMVFSGSAQGAGNLSTIVGTSLTLDLHDIVKAVNPDQGPDLSHIDIVTIDIVEALYKNSGGAHAADSSPISSERMTKESVLGVVPRPSFHITSANLPNLQPFPEFFILQAGPDSPTAERFRAAFAAHQQLIKPIDSNQKAQEQLQLKLLSQEVWNKLDPAKSVLNLVGPLVRVVDQPASSPGAADDLELLRLEPQFPQPMYEGLRDLSQDFLIPGIESVLEDTVLLLQTNPRFIEAYMAGLNHEMGRELQWRGYPAHHLNTPFRYFWDTRAQKGGPSPAIPPIEEWLPEVALGDNIFNPLKPPVALLIRGELIRRYPTAIVCAIPAVWPNGPGQPQLGTDEIYPVFHGSLKPDVTFFGFPMSEDEAVGNQTSASPGYFFVVQEHPTEPRFGVEANDPGTGNLQPQGDAAQTARKLLQLPVRIAIHAHDLLKME